MNEQRVTRLYRLSYFENEVECVGFECLEKDAAHYCRVYERRTLGPVIARKEDETNEQMLARLLARKEVLDARKAQKEAARKDQSQHRWAVVGYDSWYFLTEEKKPWSVIWTMVSKDEANRMLRIATSNVKAEDKWMYDVVRFDPKNPDKCLNRLND